MKDGTRVTNSCPLRGNASRRDLGIKYETGERKGVVTGKNMFGDIRVLWDSGEEVFVHHQCLERT